MQTLMIFWSSWRLEMIVSERQQDPQIRLLIRKSLWLVPYLSCHGLKKRDSSISLNKLVTIPLHNYLTPSWGFLAVSLSWVVESQNGAYSDTYLFIDPQSIWRYFLERILKTWQSSQDNSLEALILYFLTRAVSAFDLPTTTRFCGAQGRIRTGHTCILFIVKSKRGSMEKQVMQSRSKRASVWVDGWMDMAYSR